jgi:drug/metabolite transporter (DMT)-like permease
MLLYYLMALGCVFFWGCTFISSKILLQAGLTPVDILLLRFGLAYGMLLPFYRKHLVLPSWKDEAWMAFLGITGGSLYFLTENSAIK